MQAGRAGNGGNTRPGRRISGIVGAAMVLVGAVLLLGVAAFYAYGLYSTAQLDDLNASIDGPLSLPDEVDGPGASLDSGPAPSDNATTPPDRGPDDEASGDEPSSEPSPQPGDMVSQEASLPADSYSSIYPAHQMHPKYWGQPLWAGSDTYAPGESQRPDGFRAVSPAEGTTSGQSPPAYRIVIPSIGVDAQVEALGVVYGGDGPRYENPVHVVGRIPQSANPGEVGKGWYFGHLESPLKNEGNVFHRLPEIPRLLNNGDPVYVRLVSAEGEYLYQVVSSRVIPQEELRLYGSQESTITLVTCSRRPFYDHRQLVTAKLVGFRSGG